MTDKKQQSAEEAFLAQFARVRQEARALMEAVDDHFGYDPTKLDWGHVGSMAEAAKKLEELRAFLSY